MDDDFCEYCGRDIGLESHYHCPICKQTCGMMGHPECQEVANVNKIEVVDYTDDDVVGGDDLVKVPSGNVRSARGDQMLALLDAGDYEHPLIQEMLTECRGRPELIVYTDAELYEFMRIVLLISGPAPESVS